MRSPRLGPLPSRAVDSNTCGWFRLSQACTDTGHFVAKSFSVGSGRGFVSVDVGGATDSMPGGRLPDNA